MCFVLCGRLQQNEHNLLDLGLQSVSMYHREWVVRTRMEHLIDICRLVQSAPANRIEEETVPVPSSADNMLGVARASTPPEDRDEADSPEVPVPTLNESRQSNATIHPPGAVSAEPGQSHATVRPHAAASAESGGEINLAALAEFLQSNDAKAVSRRAQHLVYSSQCVFLQFCALGSEPACTLTDTYAIACGVCGLQATILAQRREQQQQLEANRAAEAGTPAAPSPMSRAFGAASKRIRMGHNMALRCVRSGLVCLPLVGCRVHFRYPHTGAVSL